VPVYFIVCNTDNNQVLRVCPVHVHFVYIKNGQTRKLYVYYIRVVAGITKDGEKKNDKGRNKYSMSRNQFVKQITNKNNHYINFVSCKCVFEFAYYRQVSIRITLNGKLYF